MISLAKFMKLFSEKVLEDCRQLYPEFEKEYQNLCKDLVWLNRKTGERLND